MRGVPDAQQSGSDFAWRQHKIHAACLDRAGWHTIKLRGARLLRKSDPALLANGLETERAIAADTRQHHAPRGRVPFLGEASEKLINDRRRWTQFGPRGGIQHASLESDTLVR